GGQTIRSAFGSARAPCIIFASSAPAALSPFIFQLPATSGRRPVVINRAPLLKFLHVPNPMTRPRPLGKLRKRRYTPQAPLVAAQGLGPYDARPCGTGDLCRPISSTS